MGDHGLREEGKTALPARSDVTFKENRRSLVQLVQFEPLLQMETTLRTGLLAMPTANTMIVLKTDLVCIAFVFP